MGLAVELVPTAGRERDIGCAYVTAIGTGTELWKVGKAKDYAARVKAHRTMSVERLALYAEIDTDYYGEIETYLKHLLQGYRWMEGEGTEIYQAPRAVIDAAVEAARSRAALMPRMAEADALALQPSDGTVLTPDQAIKDLHRRRLRLKQIEWEAHHEGEELDAELKLIMGAAEELTGVAIFRSGSTRRFDETAFRLDHEEMHEAYRFPRPTRNFNIHW
jgi:hypothetical protein